jgi:hypothetical protein
MYAKKRERERERERESQGHFTGDKELRQPTMAGGRKFFGRRCAVERDEELRRGKRQGSGSNSVFKGQRRRGEEAMARVLAINGRRGAGGL